MRTRPYALALSFVAGAILSVFTGAALAAGTGANPFPRYPQLEPNVAFWRDVFAKYGKREIVFHDPYHLDLVYSVADVGHLMRGEGSDSSSQRAVRAFTAAETARISNILNRLASSPPRTEEERDIATVLKGARGSLPSHRVLASRIRTQRGLGDELCGTVQRAQAWLPEMKQILAANGVPVELSSLPMVESAFRTSAHSFVGAAGVWQFTRGTGRRYMRIDHVVDERRDTIAATEAAAKYLRENFERLGSWPLAITGYNHGEAGVENAVRQIGTSDLGIITERYEGRSFGFASRNFYAEFLAAHDVMRDAHKQCGEFAPRTRPPEQRRIDNYVSLASLARCAGTDVEVLAELNPALSRDVVRGRLHVPRGYRLWVPAGTGATFDAAYASLPREAFAVAQKSTYGTHRVRSGQTLSQIAGMYGTSVSNIQKMNGIRNARYVRVGQNLKVPSRGGGSSEPVTVAKASPASTAMATASVSGSETTYVIHKVVRGQTISQIAKRYGVTTASVQKANGIRDPRELAVGQRIKIPRGSSGKVTTASYKTHRVGRGQTLSQIADLYRTTVTSLQKANGISDPRDLRSGQVIRVPL